MYLVAWQTWPISDPIKEAQRDWEIIDGEDAMQIRVSELIESGVREQDIVVGEITENTR